jgi:hypothetical protein
MFTGDSRPHMGADGCTLAVCGPITTSSQLLTPAADAL